MASEGTYGNCLFHQRGSFRPAPDFDQRELASGLDVLFPAVQQALENAPAGDIVQLSDQALQLQITDAIFGDANPSSTSSDSLFSALEAIGSNSPAGASGASLADQLAAYQGSSQLQQTDALLGITQPSTTPNSLFDVFA